MAFSPPTFNLLCTVWEGPFVTRTLRLDDLPCNLAMGRRVQQLFQNESFGLQAPASPCLLVPAGSDIRDADQDIDAPDFIEVPKDSGRWYVVSLVDDVGKGFDNEYRLVAMAKISERQNGVAYPGLWWPIPMP